jgi:hypothetical protein
MWGHWRIFQALQILFYLVLIKALQHQVGIIFLHIHDVPPEDFGFRDEAVSPKDGFMRSSGGSVVNNA